MPQIYSGHSILCLPSKLESFGLVTVEAQACGCIPVVHNVGGVTATLVDEQTGFLYSPNNVEKLAEAILKAMAAIDTDSSIRQRAIDFVSDNLSMARAAEYISKLWDRLNLAEQIKTVRDSFESNNLIAGSASDANVKTRKQKSTGEHKAADGQIVIPYNESGLRDSLVSVIMPAYNAAEHIAEAIESVLIQNYRNFELIIVDDGSTDNTRDIVAGFKDEKIKYFHKQNAGPSSARNFAIKQARGQYIMPLDADDMMTPDFIASHLQEFKKHPEADLVYSDVLLIDTNSNPIRVMKKPEYQDRRHMVRDLLRAGHPIVPFRLGIRKSVFDKIGLYD
ncbi:MAG: glycosyltransferase, partial [Planctomycetota bacterium]